MTSMRQAIILGAGGQCRVVISLLNKRNDHKILGIIDLVNPSSGECIMNLPVLGSVDRLEEYKVNPNIDIYLAIGDNKLRSVWWQKLRKYGMKMPNLISPYAIVDDNSIMGEANIICAKAFVGPEAIIGNNNLINTGAVIEHEVQLGNNCHLAPLSIVAGRSQVGDDCFIGASATVIDGIKVKNSTIIGAGATLIYNINEPGGTYIGTPAKRKK